MKAIELIHSSVRVMGEIKNVVRQNIGHRNSDKVFRTVDDVLFLNKESDIIDFVSYI